MRLAVGTPQAQQVRWCEVKKQQKKEKRSYCYIRRQICIFVHVPSIFADYLIFTTN
jgi:hypothetical protein